MFRQAVRADIDAIAAIYDRIHSEEEAGHSSTGWIRDIYPTRQTAEQAVAMGEMFVDEREGRILSCGRINREPVDVYARVPWRYEAAPEQVMVLHTLVVDPAVRGRGLGSAFVDFYEQYAREKDCPCLRMDTNERNLRARALYGRLGYREAAVMPCDFNGIPGVGLVCLEKWIG